MAERKRCEICNRSFKSQEGLDMHNAAKHSPSKKDSEDEEKSSKVNSKKFRKQLTWIIILGLVIWGVYAFTSSENSIVSTSPSEINIKSHSNVAFHIHSELKIFIDNNEFSIPSNIGISTGVMRPLHTHDSTGEIHIEGLSARDFTLGEFFEVWGREFSSECIFDNCVEEGELTMTVNGKNIENTGFESHKLRDGGNIIIKYNSFG